MGVIREKRQSGSIGPIGTVNLNTGGVEKYNSIAKAANSMFEIALNEMSRSSAKEGADRAAAVSSSQITTVNPITGRPEALDDFNADMFLGRTAGEAYERVITDRFNTEISNDIKVKANELTTKYQDNPNNIQIVSEALGEYVKNLAFGSERNGKPTLFTNFIEDNGKVEIANAKMTLTKLNHQRQKEQLANDLIEANQSDLITAYDAGKTFSLDEGTEEEARLVNTVSDFENWMESRVAKNADGVKARLLKAGADTQHRIALQAAFVSGRIENLMPSLYGNSIQRQRFILAIQSNGKNEEIINSLDPALLPELQAILKFSNPETKKSILSGLTEIDRDLTTLETREKAALLEQQRKDDEEEEDKKILAKMDAEEIKYDIIKNSELNTSDIYIKAAKTYSLFKETTSTSVNMPFKAGTIELKLLVEDALSQMTILSDNLDRMQKDPRILLKTDERLRLERTHRQSFIRGFVAIALEDGNADAFAAALNSPNSNRQGLTQYQVFVADLLRQNGLMNSDDRADIGAYIEDIKDNIRETNDAYIKRGTFIRQSAELAFEGKQGSLDPEDFAAFQREVIASNLGVTEKDKLINDIKLSVAEGVINVLEDPDSTQLNGIQLYIDSAGTSKDEAIQLLTEESLAIAKSVVEISKTFPQAKSKINAVLRSREEIIKQQEADADAALKLETKKLNNRKAVFSKTSQKTKEVRQEADLILEENGIVSPTDSSSLNPLFYALNAQTLTFNTKTTFESFMAGDRAFTEEEGEIILRHMQRLINDPIAYRANTEGVGINEGQFGGVINRLRGSFSSEDIAEMRELIARKEFYGDRRSASELLLEMRRQQEGEQSKIRRAQVFIDSRGNRISEADFVAAAIKVSNANVLEDLMPIARMYADMGYKKDLIKEKLLIEFKENYGESDHVIDFGAEATFFDGKQYSKLALTKQFPDPDQRAEFIRLVNESLPRGFRLGEPVQIGFTQKTEGIDRRRSNKETVEMDMTKQVFLVPVEGAEVNSPQYYTYFLDDDGELRPLIYEDPTDEFGNVTGNQWPMFEGNITDEFMRNKFEAEQQLLIIEAEEARKKANTPLFSDGTKRRFGIFRQLNIPLTEGEYGDTSGFLFISPDTEQAPKTSRRTGRK